MSKQTRKERKAEEERILAEFQEALKENREEGEKPKQTASALDATQPQTMHCRKCKTLMENGVCPACGFKMYMPMSEEERKKIRRVTTIVALAVFVVLFIVLQLVK